MVILEQPYVSGGLIQYLEMSQKSVLRNDFSEKIAERGHQLNLISEFDFIGQYTSTKKIYTVSEYALDWITSKLNDYGLNSRIALLKDKAMFREACRQLHPNFIFHKLPYPELFTFDISKIKFPFVLKPSVDFLSVGVYVIQDEGDWVNTLIDLQQNIQEKTNKFPDAVVRNDTFIIESYISGKEFALDLYFRDKEPVIINIFEHPFSSSKDVSDKLYTTSKKIFDGYLTTFTEYLKQLNAILNLENIPVHIELRIDGSNITPIEINPLRFAGMCLNEINFYITGRHPLHYYFSNTIPNYEIMWKGKEHDIFSFSIIEKTTSPDTDKEKIKSLYSSILEWRTVQDSDLSIEAFIFSKTKNQQELDNILNVGL